MGAVPNDFAPAVAHLLLVDDKQRRAAICERAMRLGVVRNLVTGARGQREFSTIGQLSMQLPLQTK